MIRREVKESRRVREEHVAVRKFDYESEEEGRFSGS